MTSGYTLGTSRVYTMSMVSNVLILRKKGFVVAQHLRVATQRPGARWLPVDGRTWKGWGARWDHKVTLSIFLLKLIHSLTIVRVLLSFPNDYLLIGKVTVKKVVGRQLGRSSNWVHYILSSNGKERFSFFRQIQVPLYFSFLLYIWMQDSTIRLAI
jgi:hypothetical protein